MARASRPKPKLSEMEEALNKAIVSVTGQSLVESDRIKVDGNPVFGIKTHRRRFPKYSPVKMDSIAKLETVRLRWLRDKQRHGK